MILEKSNDTPIIDIMIKLYWTGQTAWYLVNIQIFTSNTNLFCIKGSNHWSYSFLVGKFYWDVLYVNNFCKYVVKFVWLPWVTALRKFVLWPPMRRVQWISHMTLKTARTRKESEHAVYHFNHVVISQSPENWYCMICCSKLQSCWWRAMPRDRLHGLRSSATHGKWP